MLSWKRFPRRVRTLISVRPRSRNSARLAAVAGWLPRAGLSAVAADGDDVAVVQEAIEDGGGDDRITEYLRVPLFRID